MEFKNITVEEKENQVVIVTIRRPDNLNALNVETLMELERYFISLYETPVGKVRAIVVTGHGEKAFVAGADIKEMAQLSEPQARQFSEKGQRLFRLIESIKVPVIAAVNGFALGGGLELALACDFIYAAENAKFGLPEVTLGLIPGFGGTVRLSRVVGLNRAREMAMTGDLMDSAQALACGLVNRIVPQAELLKTALGVANTLATRGPIAISKIKFVVPESFDMSIDAAMALESMSFGQLFNTKDAKEGIAAFLEKRKASFHGL